MKPGDLVRVYQDPRTRKDFEGEARVVRILSRPTTVFEGMRYFDCMVNFPEDGPDTVVARVIAEPST